jgi:hypothetical protein
MHELRGFCKNSVYFQTRACEIYFFDVYGICLINKTFNSGARDLSNSWLPCAAEAFFFHLPQNIMKRSQKND